MLILLTAALTRNAISSLNTSQAILPTSQGTLSSLHNHHLRTDMINAENSDEIQAAT